MKLQQRLQQQLNKSIIIFLIVCLSFFNINDVLAANTHSIDLELSSSQYLSIADASQTGLDLSTDFTIEAWIKLEQLPSTIGLGVVVASKNDYGTSNMSYEVSFNTSDKLELRYSYTGSGADKTYIYTTNAFVVAGDVGNWVHIAVTVDISAATAIFYKNASSVSNTISASASTAIYNGNAAFQIGANLNSGTAVNFFDGLIDEVRVYNDIRTPTEISTNYQQEIPADTQGLVGYWKLNNSLLDETSNNNDLTNNNSAVFSSSVPFVGEEEARRIIIIQ